MKHPTLRSFAAFCAALLLSAGLLAQDWPQWRGPSRSGAAVGVTLPTTWPDRPKQVWKVQAGVGHSSPVVAGGRVFLFSRIGEQEAVSARDLATGKEAWHAAYGAPYQMNSAATAHGKGPKSTPAVDRGRLFTFGISGILSAWNAQDGRLLWRRDFKKDFPATSPDFGVAMSPLVAGDLVVVHAGGIGNGALLALDVATGATKWAWKGDGPAYASPVIADFGGTRQIVTQSQRNVVGVSLSDGRLLWEIPFATSYEQNSITPIVLDDLLVYAGLDKATKAVRVSAPQGKWQIAPVWENADLPMYMSTAVESGGYLYGLTHRNRGQFFCLDAKTGKTMWTTRGREGDNAAIVTAGGLVMAMTTEGELVIVRGNPKAFEPVKRYTLAESGVWAHPVPVTGGIIVKDENTLAYWMF
jgi:outer membrane protein assembly factor BamB